MSKKKDNLHVLFSSIRNKEIQCYVVDKCTLFVPLTHVRRRPTPHVQGLIQVEIVDATVSVIVSPRSRILSVSLPNICRPTSHPVSQCAQLSSYSEWWLIKLLLFRRYRDRTRSLSFLLQIQTYSCFSLRIRPIIY